MLSCRKPRSARRDVDVSGAPTRRSRQGKRDDIGEVAAAQESRVEPAHAGVRYQRHRELKCRDTLSTQHAAGDSVNGRNSDSSAGSVASDVNVNAGGRSHTTPPARFLPAWGVAARAARAHASVSASVA